MDLVSIILPMYNVAEYLPRCMEYLLHQTWPNLEIILVNDGSPDNSLQLAREYAAKDPRVKVYDYENGGVSKARNRGLSHAAGDWIMFVDPDDYIEPDGIRHMIEEAHEKDLDIVQCGFRTDFKYFVYRTASVGHKDMTGAQALHAMARNEHFHLYPWGKLYKRYTFEGIEFPEDIRCFEDAYTIFKPFARAKRAGTIPNRYYHYVQHGGSITRHMTPESRYTLKNAYQYQIEYLKKAIPEETFDYSVLNYNADMLKMYLIVVNGKEKDEISFRNKDFDWSNIPFPLISWLGYAAIYGVASLKMAELPKKEQEEQEEQVLHDSKG